MLSTFAGLAMLFPEGWCDITTDLPADSPPTLARRSGVGVLQFSVARYQRGRDPAIDESELTKMLIEFCQAHSLQSVEPRAQTKSRALCVRGASTGAKETIVVWYLSNGADVAIVTYTSLEPQNPMTQEEIVAAQTIVESIRFE